MALTKVPSNLDAAVSTTQSASDNSTNVATTAYVTTAIANLSDSAPAALNTLNEIAAALGDDANYASTTTAAIAAKLPLAGGTLTGDVQAPGVYIGSTNTSYDLYNNGTSYLNGSVVVDDNLTSNKYTMTGGSQIGQDYAYLKSNSTTSASLTLRKDSTGADSIDFLQLRNDGNGLIGKIEGDGDISFKAATFTGTVNDLTLAASGISGNASNNFALNTPHSFRLNIDSNNSATGESFIVGNNQTAVNQSNVLFKVQENGRVGIGTPNPDNLLHLNIAGSNDIGLSISNGQYDYTLGIDTSDSASFKLSRHTGLGNYDLIKFHPTTYRASFTGQVELANGKPIFSETDNGTHQYSHLCTGSFYQGSNQGVAINTNIPAYNVSGNNMFSVYIKGYVYDNAGGGIIDCCIGTYSGEGAFHNNSYTAQNIPKQWQGKIRLAKNASDKLIILLGDTDTTTNYEIAVDCAVQGFSGVDPAYFTGWTMSAFTSTSAYSGITTVQPKETQIIGFESYSTSFTKASGWHKISSSMSTESFDFGGYYDTSNGRFTPQVPGLYQINCSGYSSYSDNTGSNRYAFAIAKNGVLNRIAGGNFCVGDSPLVSMTKNVYLNGTSDYVELWMYSAVNGITVGHSSHPMWWEGYLISPSRGDTTWTI
jgi:hypothetical protein